ncbi:MAG: hypothetical protein FVQ85_14525 [Planctomycetes bacterium]|nr:hypothetical protein [Planctomycetota bacterium]
MVNLIVVLIVSGCAAFQYLKGTLVKAFAMIIVTICASVVAFAYFEALAGLFIGGRDSSLKFIPPHWIQPLSFLLLFLFTFAALQTLAEYLTRQQVDLGLWPERIGRVVCGIFLGLILSSLLITTLAMAPIPNNYPYQRFEQRRPDAERPKKTMFNNDALASGLFGTLSKGSLSGKRSFATVHPAFIDQLFLNRHNIADNIPITTSDKAIAVPRKNGAWHAPEGIKDSDGNPISPKSGHLLMFVRIAMNKGAVADAGTFTMSQLRLICKRQSDAEKPLAGKGQNVYPIGYIMAPDTVQIKRLNDVIKVTRDDFAKESMEKWIDFAFHVPAGSLPVLLEFKQNCIAQVPQPVTAEQAPPPAPFIPTSEKQTDTEKPDDPSKPQSSNNTTKKKTTSEGLGLSPIGRTLVGPQLDDYK